MAAVFAVIGAPFRLAGALYDFATYPDQWRPNEKSDQPQHDNIKWYTDTNTSTWNQSMFPDQTSSTYRKALPTSQWFQDLSEPQYNSASPTEVLPYSMRRTLCGVDVSPLNSVMENMGRRATSTFTPSVGIHVNEFAAAVDAEGNVSCSSGLTDYGFFHALVHHQVTSGTTRVGDGLDIDSLAGVGVFSPVEYSSSMLNITLKSGEQWLLWVPKVQVLQVSQDYVAFTEPPDHCTSNAWSRLAFSHSCIATGADLQWKVAPANCVPLSVLAPHHRASWQGEAL
eukprot:gene36709-51451_t